MSPRRGPFDSTMLAALSGVPATVDDEMADNFVDADYPEPIGRRALATGGQHVSLTVGAGRPIRLHMNYRTLQRISMDQREGAP